MWTIFGLGKSIINNQLSLQRSAKVFFLIGCVTRPPAPRGESRNLGKSLCRLDDSNGKFGTQVSISSRASHHPGVVVTIGSVVVVSVVVVVGLIVVVFVPENGISILSRVTLLFSLIMVQTQRML